MYLNEMLAGLPSKPKFTFFEHDDYNAVSGRHKKRTVANPNRAMELLQKRLLQRLRKYDGQQQANLLRFSTSCKRGDSALNNARQHRNNRHFYLVDFKNAYKNVDAEKLARILLEQPMFQDEKLEDMASFLHIYCIDAKHGLVQGGTASQDLFNLYAGTLVDMRVAKLFEESDITYTRYLDDLTFSSNSEISGELRRKIRNCILEAGFEINHKKCSVVDLKKTTVVITGIGLADGGRLFVPRHYTRKLAGILHRAITDTDIDKRRIIGMMAQFQQVLSANSQEPNELEKKILRAYTRFPWAI